MPRKNDNSFTGVVYAMTNSATDNEVVAFQRRSDGTLIIIDSFSTGGRGTGAQVVDPLSSQGSLILSPCNRFLFAVNAGNNTISSFRVLSNGALDLIDVVPSGGVKPNSLAVFKNLLYVSNVGDTSSNSTSNITGFRIAQEGTLCRILFSRHALSTPNAQPSCIVFGPDGKFLVVSELNTNRLSVFPVNCDGTVDDPIVNNSSGLGPFGSVFLSCGLLLVTESGTNALSSYELTPSGRLEVISGSVRNGQIATCWVSVSRDEQFAYTSNAGGDGTITVYRINRNGTLEVVQNVLSIPDGGPIGAAIDNGVSKDGRNLYVLNGNQGSISVFAINCNGTLKRLQVLDSDELPNLGSQGLAVI